MSYTFLFKYIIIGDSGIVSVIIHRGRKVLPSSSVHRQKISRQALSHHRRLVRRQNHLSQIQQHQTTNLGHCKLSPYPRLDSKALKPSPEDTTEML